MGTHESRIIVASLKILLYVLVQNAKKEQTCISLTPIFTMYKLEGRSYCVSLIGLVGWLFMNCILCYADASSGIENNLNTAFA